MIIDFLYIPRSGGHAVMNWAASLFEEDVYLYNTCHPDGTTMMSKEDPIWTSGYCKCPTTDYGAQPEEKGIIFRSFEGPNSIDYNPIIFPDQKIYIIRDPFNLAASLLQKVAKLNHRPESWVLRNKPMWIKHIKTIINNSCPFISFNNWFLHKSYRDFMADMHFEKENTDIAINQVPRISGLGSSFDRTEFDGKAQQMDVINRWKEWKCNSTFKEFVLDPEVLDLSYQMWGMENVEKIEKEIREA